MTIEPRRQEMIRVYRHFSDEPEKLADNTIAELKKNYEINAGRPPTEKQLGEMINSIIEHCRSQL